MPEDSNQDRAETPAERAIRARDEALKNLDPNPVIGRVGGEYPRSSYTTGTGSAELQELRAIRELLERVVTLLEADHGDAS